MTWFNSTPTPRATQIWGLAVSLKNTGHMASGVKHPYFTRIFLLILQSWELFAIVIAVELWTPQLQGKHIVLHTDSSATVGWIVRERFSIPAAMQLIRHLTMTCLQFQIVIKAVHLGGVLNQKSNWISRGCFHWLHQHFPHMDLMPTPLLSSL